MSAVTGMDLIGWGITLWINFMVFAWLYNTVTRNKQRFQGRDRCHTCASRMKRVPGGYSSVCAHCGTVQPWAKWTES